MSLNQKKYLSRTPSFFDKLSSFMLHSNISSFNSNYDINNQNTFGKFKNNEFLNYQINNKIDNYNNGSPYLYNFNQNLDNLKVVNEDLRKISESSNELSTEDDCSDNSPIVDYTLNRNTTIKNDSIEDDYYSNSDIKYQQDDVTPVDEDEFIGRVGEVSVGSFYEDADEVRRGDTNFENNYFNTNKYSAIGFKDSNEGECNYDKQQYNNKLSNSNSFPSSSFSVDNYPLENSSFQNDSPKRKRRNSISQVIDIAKNRENFQSQSKDFMRTGSLYSSSPSPLMRLKASRSTPSLSRYHSGDEKTLRSIMKKQNLMDSYSCPNTASSKMAVSFKESVQVVNYDPHDYTTGLKSPFPISVKQSPKINSIFRSPTIDRDYVSKTSPKISFKETEDRSKYLEDSIKISFKEPTKNSIVPNRKNSVTKFKNSNFSNDFTSGKSRGDNKSIDGKRNYLNVVQMDSEQDNTEININLKNTFTPSDMKSVLRVTSGGGGDSNGNNNDGAITKKNKLDTGAASAAAFYSDDSLKRLNKSTDSTNHHYHEVSEMFEENNKEPETNFEPYIVPSSKEFQINNNMEFSKLNSAYTERKRLLFGEDSQSDNEENTCIDNIIDKEKQKVQSSNNIRERANKFLGKITLNNNRSRSFNRTISEIDQRLIIVNNELSDLQIEMVNLRQERKVLKKRRRRIIKSANKLNEKFVSNQDGLYFNDNNNQFRSDSPVRKSLRKINSVIESVSGSLLEAASASLSRSGSVSGTGTGSTSTSPHDYITTNITDTNSNQDDTYYSNEFNDSIHTINEKNREKFSIRSIVPWLNFTHQENDIENWNRISNNEDELMSLEDKFKKDRKIKPLRPIKSYRNQIEYSNGDTYNSNENSSKNYYSTFNVSKSKVPSPSQTIKNFKFNPIQQENMYHSNHNDHQEYDDGEEDEEVSCDDQNSDDNGNDQDVDSPETEALNCFKFLSILSDEEFVTRISETERLLSLG